MMLDMKSGNIIIILRILLLWREFIIFVESRSIVIIIIDIIGRGGVNDAIISGRDMR